MIKFFSKLMENHNERKYTSSDRRKIVNKISKLKETKDFVAIFNIVESELGKNISINRNGVFFNINILSDDAIEKIDTLLSQHFDTVTETDSKIKYKPYSIDELGNIPKLGPKLSNQEKSIIKKFQNK